MDYALPIGSLVVTIQALSQRHLWRLQALPVEKTAPKPPEGYSHVQALENIPDYARQYELYNANVYFEQATRAVGAARILAFQTPQGEAESDAINDLCILYTLDFPDDQKDPARCGNLLWALGDELLAGTGIDGADIIVEAYSWLSMQAGGVDAAVIEEAIKSIRRNRGRSSTGSGVQDGQGSPESGKSGADDKGKPAPGPGGRRKKLGPKSALRNVVVG